MDIRQWQRVNYTDCNYNELLRQSPVLFLVSMCVAARETERKGEK